MKGIAIATGVTGIGVVAVATALAAPASPISSTSIAGATVGLPASAYEQALGTPVRKEALKVPDGYSRLVFTKRKIAVYFKAGTDKAVAVTTWNAGLKTSAGVGPCSSIEQVKAAYGGKLKPSKPNTLGPRIYAYTVGRLIFAAAGRDPKPGPSKHVTAVALYSGIPGPANGGALAYAGFLALNETGCS